MGIRDYLSDLTRSGAIRGAIGRAFRKRRRGADDSARVLVVVRDAALRDAIVAALRHPAYAVRTAPSAREALALMRSHDPDVVLVDVAQPADGEGELLPILRRRRPEAATIALVPRLAGGPGTEAGRVAEADATLHMPFDGPTLIDAVERVLGAD